jgi:hypothetical protein
MPIRRVHPAFAARLHGCAALLGMTLALCVNAAHAADEAQRWRALFERVPPLPVTLADAAASISARRVHSEGLGIVQLRIEVADARLRALQLEVDRLYEPTAQASKAQFQRVIDAANKDPALIERARKLDEAWRPDPSRPGAMPSMEQMREIERVLGPTAASAAQMPPRSEIAAYRQELERAAPRVGSSLQRLSEQQRQYAKQHAQADHDAKRQLAGGDVATVARSVVARHHALAQQQLADAATILEQARAAMAPRVQRMAELALAAEQRNAPPAERNEAYALLKAWIEHLLTLQREALQDVGFWAAVRVVSPWPAAGGWPIYELALAPGFDLQAAGELPYGLPYYPIGRAIVFDLPPGIR